MQEIVIITADNPQRFHRETKPGRGYLNRIIRRSACGLSEAVWNLYFIPRDQAKDRGLSGCKRCYRNESK